MKLLLSSTSLYVAVLCLPSIDSGLGWHKIITMQSFSKTSIVSAKSLLKPSSDFDLISLRVVTIVRTSLYTYSTSIVSICNLRVSPLNEMRTSSKILKESKKREDCS